MGSGHFLIRQAPKQAKNNKRHRISASAWIFVFLVLFNHKLSYYIWYEYGKHFPVRDTFHHWFFATRNKFDVMQTIRKTYFLNFALDLLAHSIPKWQFSIFISKPWYNMKIYGWIGQTKQKSIQRQKFHVFFCFLACFGAWRIKKWPNPKI